MRQPGFVTLVAMSCAAIGFSGFAIADDGIPGQQIRTLSARFKNGVPYSSTDPNYAKMLSLLQQGNTMGAADIAAHDRDFLEQTLRNLFAPMVNLAQDPTDNSMTDTLALMIGTVKDDRYFPEILYTSAQYVCKNASFTSTRATYAKCVAPTVNFLTDLTRVDDGTDPIGYGLPAGDRSGILTTDKWALEYDKAGTNRRNIKGIMQFLGLQIDNLRAPVTPDRIAALGPMGLDTWIGRDVSRLPDPTTPSMFLNNCAQCHIVIDAMRDAFFYVDYKNATGAPGGMGIAPVPTGAGKYAINTTNAPSGHVTTNNAWINTMDPTVRSFLAWDNTHTAGSGIQSLGMAWANTGALQTALVNRAATQFCPGVTLDQATVQNLSAGFALNGNFRQLCESIAVLPQCLASN